MSDLLSIGASAVKAYKGALGAVGENVANAETPGYARRTTVLKQAPTPGLSPDPVYREQVLFSGVDIAGVQRAWDTFRASEARHAASAAGQASVRSQWLTSVETAFGNGSATIGSSLTAFFSAATALSTKPDDALGRSVMMNALQDVAAAFRVNADALGRVADGIQSAAALDVEGVNGALRALHEINGTIRASAPGGAARAALEDERDRLIDYVAERLDISTSTGGDGTVSLTLGGASTVSLLNGVGPGQIGLQVASDGRLALHITKEGAAAPLPVTSGRMAGLLQMAGSTADRRAALDALAADFAAELNAWSAGGLDADANPGGPLLDASGGAATMQLVITDPSAIAAAATDGTPNGNLLALDSLRGPNGAEARWGALVSDVATALAAARSQSTAAESWKANSYAALDEVTGVDLDREAADLLRFQQAYSAATRIIQVARETFDTILRAL